MMITFCSIFLGGRLNKTIILLALVGYKMILANSALYPALAIYLTIILRNRAEYRLILSRRGHRPSRLKSDNIPRD